MINVNFTGYTTYTVDKVTQWDVNRKLRITGLSLTVPAVIYFSNKKSVTASGVNATRSGGVITCDVPNALLTESYPIYAYIQITEGGETKTVETIKIPVTAAKEPDDYVFYDNIPVVTYGSLETEIDRLRAAVGSPLVAATVAEMTEHDKIYVYVGSETGYTSGNWYYYDGSAWTSGGIYNSTAFETDKTLSVEDMAADAAAVGVELAKSMRVFGVLPNNTDLNTINTNSIYILDSSKTYINGPETPTSGYLFTSVSGNLVQQIFYKFATTFASGAGKMWYRNALVNTWRTWGRINLTEPEISEISSANSDRIRSMNYDGNETTPESLFANRTPFHYSSFIALSWITEQINNIANASSIINFGSESRTNAAAIGVEKTTLKTFVASPANNSGSNLYVYGNEQNATVKLTSFSKKLYMFGDSITWGRDGDKASSSETGFRCQNTFSSVIQRNLGITAINFGIGDQGWLAQGSNGRNAYQEIINHNITGGDYFTLAWGVNDRSEIMTNGAFDADKLGVYTDTSGTSLMAEVYKCVNKIYEIKPQCHVILIAPWNGRNVGSFPAYKFADTTYAALIAELKKFADYYYLPWIGDDCPLNGWGMKSGALMGNDGVHPCAKGYEFLGNWLSGEIGKIIG